MKRARLAALSLAAFVAVCANAWAQAPDEGGLLKIITQDSAYKVRMQAIRVLQKRMEQSKETPSQGVIDGLGRAATSDESYLVRGMACVALGSFGDVRAKGALTGALRDSEPFVREQATQALAKLGKQAPPPPPIAPPSSGRALLVVATDTTPGIAVDQQILDALKAMLEEGFRGQAGERYTVGSSGEGKGYHMKGSISELSVAAQPDGNQRVTVVVKITIATWPDNNLRHVMSAKAATQTRASGGALTKVQEKLLRAAVDRAVKDSMAEIGGG